MVKKTVAAPKASTSAASKPEPKAVKNAAPTGAAKASRAAAKTPVVQPVKAAPKSSKKAPTEKDVKAAKPKKIKLVRDSFTIPEDEVDVLSLLKQRCLKQGHACKKSELLRAGIKALAAMDDARLLAALQAVPAIKTGRPAKA